MDSISVTRLYHIINRTIAEVDKYTGEPINKEMQLFKERYSYHLRHNPAQSLFSERRPLIKEVAQALDFCEALQAYHLAMDVDAKDQPALSEQDCRLLLEGINIYREYIYQENMSQLKMIEKCVKRQHPEYCQAYLLEDYRREALFVIQRRKHYQKAIKNKQPATKDYENYALYFYEKITGDDKMKRVGICPEKMELYKLTLEIVDCLPKEKYNRTDKFKLKSRLWNCIAKSLLILDKTNTAAIEEARSETARYARAAENAMAHATNYKVVSAIRRKKQNDEWNYR